jgi:excisionase family DNA binding protein
MHEVSEKEEASTRNRPWDQRGSLLTARETVEYLSISLSTLNRMERQGLLVPFRTPGGHRRYDKAMLDDYLETTRRRPGRPSPKSGFDDRSSDDDERSR